MPLILGIIAALALFIPTIADPTPANALTPAQIELGRVEGFHAKPSYDHQGDYLLNTYCFCCLPTSAREQDSEAHYIQIEYYNWHQNTTYILSHLCLASQDSKITCFAPHSGPHFARPKGVDLDRFCRTWYSVFEFDGVNIENELCYELSTKDDIWRQYRLPGPDRIWFNGKKRRLHTLGRQGPLLWDRQEAEDRCEDMCDKHARMPSVKGAEMAASHIISWEDMDDMCIGCK